MKELIENEKRLGSFSRINYFFYTKVWGTLIVTLMLLLVIALNSDADKNNIYLSVMCFLWVILFVFYVLPGKDVRYELQHAVFKDLIFGDQSLEQFVESFFLYKKMRGLLSGTEVEIVGEQYAKLLKQYVPNKDDVTDEQTDALKNVPNLKEFLAWYAKSIQKEHFLPKTAIFITQHLH